MVMLVVKRALRQRSADYAERRAAVKRGQSSIVRLCAARWLSRADALSRFAPWRLFRAPRGHDVVCVRIPSLQDADRVRHAETLAEEPSDGDVIRGIFQRANERMR